MTTPQLTVGYADNGITVEYADHRPVLLTRQGAIDTATARCRCRSRHGRLRLDA